MAISAKYNPALPYTRALISSVPHLNGSPQSYTPLLSGEPPSPIHPPSGCAFHARCPIADLPRCRDHAPELRALSSTHQVACHLAT